MFLCSEDADVTVESGGGAVIIKTIADGQFCEKVPYSLDFTVTYVLKTGL